mgnify:CR=1 FL=1
MTADTSNALITQNETLASKISKAEDSKDLHKVEEQINFLEPLWDSLGYGYKIEELRSRINRKAWSLAYELRGYIGKLRKNDRTRASAEADLAILETYGSN